MTEQTNAPGYHRDFEAHKCTDAQTRDSTNCDLYESGECYSEARVYCGHLSHGPDHIGEEADVGKVQESCES